MKQPATVINDTFRYWRRLRQWSDERGGPDEFVQQPQKAKRRESVWAYPSTNGDFTTESQL
jgi:hypothetical protein